MISSKNENAEYLSFKITIIGITLYLLLFEGRSKYLFMFLPIYVSFAGVILSELLDIAKEIRMCILQLKHNDRVNKL